MGATTAALPAHAEVLILAAELAAGQGVDLAAFLEANPGALDELGEDDSASPIDLSGEGDLQ